MKDAEKLATLYTRAGALAVAIAGGEPVASKEKMAEVAKALGWKDVDIIPTGVIGDEPYFLGGKVAYYSADHYFPTISENFADQILNLKGKLPRAQQSDPYDTRGNPETWA